ncbi:MAG TPA: surface-adhesin E family protein, partial [Gemmatimonadaceae bacterium]
PRTTVALCVTAVAAAACSSTPPDSSPRWVRVARDANYTIYIDTGRLSSYDAPHYMGRTYQVWYRTDHAMPRVHEGDNKVFNREVVHSIIACDSLVFRVASVDMSMGHDRPIVQQTLTDKELAYQKWRHVELGTAEEIAARAACHFAKQLGIPAR